MLKALLEHELNNLLKSKRIYTTVIMFLLLFVSIFVVRVIDYQKQVNQYIDDVRQNEEGLRSAENYSFINPRAIQQPIVFSIYNEGFKIPRVLDIQYYEPILIATSLNEEDNIFFIDNTRLDITFLITFFLSLFILLISYDSVNGEKQVGTLRIMMTYQLKRQTFILKKMLGVFFFVAITFTIPYVLSIFSLIYMFTNLLSINFFLSAFFYWFLTMLFILFFSLLGIFISCCTTNPNRSLVYSLLVWILFSIVLPISWDYIISPRLYDEQVNQLQQIYSDKWNERAMMRIEAPYQGGNFIRYSGEGFYNSYVFAFKDTMENRNLFLRYMYDEVYPLTFEVEQARDDVFRKITNTENAKNWVFFFNPIVLFNNLSMKITGNSRDDYLRFMHIAREIRNELVGLGIEDGWLLDYRFNAFVLEEYNTLDMFELVEQYEGNHHGMFAYISELVENATRYEMRLPVFRKYEQPIYSFGEIFERIFVVLVLFVVSIVVLWVMTWRKFLKYDVR